MSKRISKKRARELYEKDLELPQMQREGKTLPVSDRRHKKHLLQIKKQKGSLKYLIERYRLHGHIEKAKEMEKKNI